MFDVSADIQESRLREYIEKGDLPPEVVELMDSQDIPDTARSLLYVFREKVRAAKINADDCQRQM